MGSEIVHCCGDFIGVVAVNVSTIKLDQKVFSLNVVLKLTFIKERSKTLFLLNSNSAFSLPM